MFATSLHPACTNDIVFTCIGGDTSQLPIAGSTFKEHSKMIQTPVSHTPITLAAPCLPQSHKQGIGLLAASRLVVHIAPYPEMEAADLIELFWGDCYVASKLLTESDIGQTSVLQVPESFLLSGKVQTYFRVTKIGCEPVKSPSCKLWVKLENPGGHLMSADGEENQGLAPVRLADTIMRNGLTLPPASEGVQVTIDSYLNMQAYDEITLRWGDVRMDLPALTDQDVGHAIEIQVPAALIKEAGTQTDQEVSYCVIDRVGNNSRWAPPCLVSVVIGDSAG